MQKTMMERWKARFMAFKLFCGRYVRSIIKILEKTRHDYEYFYFPSVASTVPLQRHCIMIPLTIFRLVLLSCASTYAVAQISLAAPLLPTSVASASNPGRTNEAQAAAILDPIAECTPYYYAPVGNLVSTYPTIWQTANLSDAYVQVDFCCSLVCIAIIN